MNAPAFVALALASALAAAPSVRATTPAAPKPGASATLAAARSLAQRLARAGRASATVTRAAESEAGGFGSARLTLQVPDRARIDFPETHETLVLRGAEGEWLQPELEQLLSFGPVSLAPAVRWWRLLLPGAAAEFAERAPAAGSGGRTYAVWPRADAADSAWVTLGADGLPSRLRYRDPAGESVTLAFSNWRFSPKRPERDFHLAPPPGTNVITLP